MYGLSCPMAMIPNIKPTFLEDDYDTDWTGLTMPTDPQEVSSPFIAHNTNATTDEYRVYFYDATNEAWLYAALTLVA